MQKIACFIFTTAVAFYNRYLANTILTDDTRAGEKIQESVDLETLIIFDFDDVLMTSKDQVFWTQNRNYLEKLNRDLKHLYGDKNVDSIYSIICA